MNMKWMLAACLAATALHAPALSAPADPAEAPALQRFTVTIEGSGPDLIMIPGLTSGRDVWNGAVAGLGRPYRVHRLQLAGFAGDPAGANAEGEILAPLVEELHAYIQRSGLQRPAIVGHSMGGLIALMLAQRYPQDAGRLLIVDALPFYSLLFSPDATADAVRPQAAAMREAISAADPQAFASQQAALMERLVRNEAARQSLLATSLASDRGVAARAMFEVMTTDVRPGLGSIAAPVTIVYATNSFAPEATVGPLFRGAYAPLANARFIEVPDSYHFLMIDQPDRFSTILANFMTAD